jgi:TonB family protein
MRRMLAVSVGVMLSVFAAGAWAQEDAQASGADTWAKLLAANNLDVKGNTPFHLGMTFQLYDLKGKAAETGSFETWWAAPGSERTEFRLAGLNADGSAPAGADAVLVRNSYLVRQLMESAIHPVPKMQKAEEMTTAKLEYGKIHLDCTGPKASALEAMNATAATLCVAPQTTDLLLLQALGGKEILIRPKTGKLRDTYVALDLQLGYLGRDAITGKLSMMKDFDPEKSDVKLATPAGPEPGAVHISGRVIAGHRTKFIQPEYPMVAKMQHMSGSVLLRAIIAKDGSVERLVPIASTDTMFTDAAMEAVKKWTYSPYLLNGEPTEVDTMITVNFALNGMN